MREIIQFNNIVKEYTTKAFGKKPKVDRVLDDLSFSLHQEECIGFIGPNGSGKSTTIKILSGIIEPTQGSVLVDGLEPIKHRALLSRKVGVIFGHCQQLYNQFTVEQNFELYKNIYGMDEDIYAQRLSEIDRFFNVATLFSKRAGNLSLGQRMKSDISLVLLPNPSIIFLDEPTIGLDILAKRQFRTILKEIAKQGKKTLILTSHDMDDIEDICHRVIMINKGKLVYDGSIEKLKYEYRKTKIVHVITSDFPQSWDFKGCQILERSPDKVSIEVYLGLASIDKVLESLVRDSSFVDISIENESLESIIGDFYGR